MSDLPEAPIRNCCFQRHYGVVCPDGKVMCCLCFDRFDIADLHVTEDGRPEDVCRACADHEAVMRSRRGR